jgi:hypothetical protein
MTLFFMRPSSSVERFTDTYLNKLFEFGFKEIFGFAKTLPVKPKRGERFYGVPHALDNLFFCYVWFTLREPRVLDYLL